MFLLFRFLHSNAPDNKCHKQKLRILFFTRIKLVTRVLACACAIARIKCRRLLHPLIQSRLCLFSYYSLLSMLFLIFDTIALTFLISLISAYVIRFVCNTSLLTLANFLAYILYISVYSLYILSLLCFFYTAVYRFFWLCMFLMGFLIHNRKGIKFSCTPKWTIFCLISCIFGIFCIF